MYKFPMSSAHLDSLSPFGRLAVKLDGDFSELARLSGQLQRLDIDSDSGLDRAVRLLDQFAQHAQNISGGMRDFSRFLQEAREQSEAAAKLVAERAQLIRLRKQEQDKILEKLTQVEQNVKTANANLAGFRKQGKSEFSNEEKLRIRAELERLNVDLKRFVADAQTIKEAAGQSKFKSIERDAEALLDALRSSCRKINKVIGGQ